MALHIHNTLTRKKEKFVPLNPQRVTMYVCGPTVYNYVHIGNARPAVVFDVLFRLLKEEYPHVVYARNITDVDDKIIDAAKDEGVDIDTISQRYTQAYHKDIQALGVLDPTVEPFATGHIQAMIDMVQSLVDRGHAYEAEGHVVFDVPSMPEYGQLSGRNRDEMIAGARVEVATYKKDPSDFVLWKPSTDDQPGWNSPWGIGRPGWHLECSAMIKAHLGEVIDIHGGGQDLIFPHHENEIAQGRCAHDTDDYVRYWVHNGYLTIDGEKMSKSLGNFLTLHDALAVAPGEAIRYALLSAQYRQPLDWSEDSLKQARASLDRLYNALRQVQDIQPVPKHTEPPIEIINALEDDLNTPVAMAHLHELVSALNKTSEHGVQARLKSEILAAGDIMGFLQQDPEAWFHWQPASQQGLTDQDIEGLVTERSDARSGRNFQRADEIRDQLTAAGIELEDGPEGTRWRRTG
ncbi:MAG: cysteine--tRNA ligase [Gammaproteobacteria bacterium]|nr:MAG: cysteine--tRNA ligase [Gammaproteobacteria bacterium]